MTNMLATIVPKSDQLNYDDFSVGQSKTIKVTKVSIAAGEQPIAVNFEGDNGKPFMPCKSMRRVLVHCWGSDGNQYVGRSMTLYGDPKVKFGGLEVGGIRISHLSDIPEAKTMALTATKASRKPFTVQPLVAEKGLSTDEWIADIEAVTTLEGLKHKYAQAAKAFKDSKDFARISAAKDKRKAELIPAEGVAP